MDSADDLLLLLEQERSRGEDDFHRVVGPDS
jgi:hypothetical protein